MPKLWNRLRSLSVAAAATDEEMAKKDDDLKLPAAGSSTWSPARIAPRRFLRRLTIAFVFFGVIYLVLGLFRPAVAPEFRDYVPNFPKYDGPGLTHFDRVWPPSPPQSEPHLGLHSGHQKVDVEDSAGLDSAASRDARTSLSLPFLPLTLKGKSPTVDDERNTNVLFASSSLRSAAALLPLACEMGRRRHNKVHYAVMNRNEMPISQLKKIHGIDDSCGVTFHDARPDSPSESTDVRVRVAAERALHYLASYLNPHAVIVDGANVEYPFFLAGIRSQAEVSELSVIELPENGPERLGWLARLDSSSLSAWNKIDIEIVIHAPPTGSGSLIRLLRSLGRADFSPFPTPRLTIELPQHTEPPFEKFLKTFSWPPRKGDQPSNLQMLSLRHRLPRRNMDEDASVARFLESTWPKSPEHSHVLVLAPNVELSPQFPHYLKYALLEYVYSASSVRQKWDERLVGINLDLPSTYLNASEVFVPPTNPDFASSAFLWQAPSSNAVLITGKKWAELHAFVSRSLDFRSTAATVPAILINKVVSKTYPAWLENLAQLCRLRGYFTLYPSPETAATLATVHQDLAQPPEEYANSPPPPMKKGKEVVLGENSRDTLHTLPHDGDLLPPDALPLLGWAGDETTLAKVDEGAVRYADEFRTAVGCTGAGKDGADDLFCK
ncbi:uncharacterized protein DNG_01619 [Cephalotrichum gorgonifer]|uniref:Glycosyltransferase 2 n=1 Tax=Cephalotrichum gorgonifer TaxID=2041049 RepID=A0AAE8MSZ5_9PEZI|nr:uncharacterized protein DNG_01619 [Cephalotrichum gorgonifer]